MTFNPRLGCSTISFRHQRLAEALATIRAAGFEEIDLGALPGVCDHVPFVLDADAVGAVAEAVLASGLRVRSVNGDIGDLNRVLSAGERSARESHLDMLLSLTRAIGARALVLPCGALDHEPFRSLDEDLDAVAAELTAASGRARAVGVELWTESLHFLRLCWNIDRAARLTDRLAGSDVGIVMDFSHVTASGGSPIDFVDRFGPAIRHVHLRDAVPGNIRLSIGNGVADFAGGLRALAELGYRGHFSLELETGDVTDAERPAAAVAAASVLSPLLGTRANPALHSLLF
ncbi:sugar phosphate isomerase/epimerase family protein [Mycetocola zhujimingii]|uniref:Xylose isomerase n=1 Tax=Mycetocola zhujimingii TaxID=2079792 RepID=A0A2U1TFA8_9MICO|nr:sugar phosphate isomerase/epimerase [Mycetocola zhujimingii]PWC07569.1 xylose isomerase [Mycetocola zhujimingii]